MHNNHTNNHTWTRQLVLEHLEEAVLTTRRLPSVQVQGYFNSWPGIIHTPSELMLIEARPMRLQATPDAIFRLERTFKLMQWLSVLERKLVWRRASKTPWKRICWEFGVSESTATRKWKYALTKICERLNNKNNNKTS